MYKEFSTFGNMSGGTPKSNLDFTQKFPPSLPPSRTTQVCITIMERCRKLSWVLQISDFVTPMLLTPSQFEEQQVITHYSSSSSSGMREDLLSMIAPPHTWVSVGTSTTCM